MDLLPLGLAVPAIGTTIGAVGRAVSVVKSPFEKLLDSTSQVLLSGDGSREIESSLAKSSQTPELETSQALLGEILAQGSLQKDLSKAQLESFRERAELSLRNLEQRIRQTLANAGVELDRPIELSYSEIDGTIEVAAGHPQRAVIEAALAADPSIAEDFRNLSAIHELLLNNGVSDSNREDKRFVAIFEEESLGGELRLRFV